MLNMNNSQVIQYGIPKLYYVTMQYSKCRNEWAISFRSGEAMQGINTNCMLCCIWDMNIRDIVLRRVKAHTCNLVQFLLFITVTFELYYECRLLAVAHIRMDRYI